VTQLPDGNGHDDGLCNRVVRYMGTDVSQENNASIRTEDGGSMFLRNVCMNLLDCPEDQIMNLYSHDF
jgi:hypothetical protein